ncbi:MAG TPA: molybdate ABC transporter permease subunit [Steroidobacteraceae bacterium]|jgi:molybdate transport system permease protein|nr:molybdate ABC transporter permease subunit [Steroidobacteraceae bacterium]
MIASFYSPDDLVALWISLKLAAVTVALLLLLCTPLAWWLATTRSRLRVIGEAMASLPLVLPPTVLGFYLLLFLGPYGWGGRLTHQLGLQPLSFSFGGLVVGSMLYSMPFVIQPLQGAFQAVGARALEVAATLRAAPWDRFFTVALPLARRGFITGSVLAFAHTLGEFGVVLMLGGNIPGRTQTASIVIFNHVEALDYSGAQRLSITLLVACFALLLIVYSANRRGAEAAAAA